MPHFVQSADMDIGHTICTQKMLSDMEPEHTRRTMAIMLAAVSQNYNIESTNQLVHTMYQCPLHHTLHSALSATIFPSNQPITLHFNYKVQYVYIYNSKRIDSEKREKGRRSKVESKWSHKKALAEKIMVKTDKYVRSTREFMYWMSAPECSMNPIHRLRLTMCDSVSIGYYKIIK